LRRVLARLRVIVLLVEVLGLEVEAALPLLLRLVAEVLSVSGALRLRKAAFLVAPLVALLASVRRLFTSLVRLLLSLALS
jgi:hypothetical protein